MTLLQDLGATLPVVAAPMAGGPSTPELVVAAQQAGGLGFLAAGYRTAEQLAGQVTAVRQETDVFGVNVFAPNPEPVSRTEYAAYARRLDEIMSPLGVDVLGILPREDDDAWAAKLQLLLDDPVPVVSLTFGLPPEGTIGQLREKGTVVLQTVTSLDEARQAAAAGVDGLVVQSSAAGGHSATFTPRSTRAETVLADLVAEVRANVELPVWAAGGIADAVHVRAALDAGAEAVAVGSVLLRSPESGTSPTTRAGIAHGIAHGVETTVTRAFSGRPARGLRNEFIEWFDAEAPVGYPAVHHLTSPLRKSAADRGIFEHVNLWAGTGYAAGTEEPADEVLRRLAPPV
jgi:NAD(P)H-dependent flavin oxidoreductase YrpB (nitropropane dioxygenase family)